MSITSAPARLANWTVIEPTPPAAPEIATVSPCFRDTARTDAYAVLPAMASDPATSQDTFAGLRVRFCASTTTTYWRQSWIRLCRTLSADRRGHRQPTRRDLYHRWRGHRSAPERPIASRFAPPFWRWRATDRTTLLASLAFMACAHLFPERHRLIVGHDWIVNSVQSSR
jgi:hypothetical protein